MESNKNSTQLRGAESGRRRHVLKGGILFIEYKKMQDAKNTLVQVKSLLESILDVENLSPEQAYALKKLSVELKKISVK